jgi:choline kinase
METLEEKKAPPGLVAIILAAGVGRRFGSEMDDTPKGLLRVGGETLLARLVRQLQAVGVSRITIVTGHLGALVDEAFADVPEVEILVNPDYTRGAILSLWTARGHLDGPVLVMDADVWGPDELLARLVCSPHENCLLLDGRAAASGEEQMLMVRGERVHDISRRPQGDWDLLGESVGFLKLSALAAREFGTLLRVRIERGDLDREHEEAYPELMARVVIGFERVDDLDWTEIDFPEDLERARELATR